MDFLSTTILSGLLYDGFKASASITADFLKQKLQGWLFDDEVLEQLSETLRQMDMDELGEHSIEKRLNQSTDVLAYLKQIVPDGSQTIGSVTQAHYGQGDNVAGHKTVYK